MLPDKVRKINIYGLLKIIDESERSLSKILNLRAVEDLMGLYQQAVEYFSAINDPQFEIFIKRSHQLLSNDLIQNILISKSNETIENYGFIFEDLQEKVMVNQFRTEESIELVEMRVESEDSELLNNSREPTEGEESGHSTDSEPHD